MNRPCAEKKDPLRCRSGLARERQSGDGCRLQATELQELRARVGGGCNSPLVERAAFRRLQSRKIAVGNDLAGGLTGWRAAKRFERYRKGRARSDVPEQCGWHTDLHGLAGRDQSE